MECEKIIIGPIMVLSEMLLLGHYMENIKILKQISDQTYPQIIRHMWGQYGRKSFFLGLYPWGLLQTVKGLPIAFVQSKVYNHLTDYNETHRMLISGFSSGVVQGIFLTPTQRMKTIMMTKSPTYVYQYQYKSLFHGIGPMMLRRGTDWCLRFYGVHLIERRLNKKIENMTLSEKIGAGFLGGALSGLTNPIDVIIARTQESKNIDQNAWKILQKTNYRMLTQGMTMKMLNAGHHTAFVVGVGDYLYHKLKPIYKNI